MSLDLFHSLATPLAQVEDLLESHLKKHPDYLSQPSLELFQAGGKRLRPALLLLCCQGFGEITQGAIEVATAIEMIHGASLVHDDVLDEADLRRGQPTCNQTQGNQIAVLLGDFLLSESLLLVAKQNQPSLLKKVAQAVSDLTQGQIFEAKLQHEPHTSLNDYLIMIGGKTASLIAASCALGAQLGGANPQQILAMRRFGEQLGFGFQMVDDILDYWGTQEQLGKATGSDLREGKYTLPFLIVRENLKEKDRRELFLVSDSQKESFDLTRVLQILEKYNAHPKSLAQAQLSLDKALEQLQHVEKEFAREQLQAMLKMVKIRTK